MFCEISSEIFENKPEIIFGIVAARGLKNDKPVPAVQKMLEDKGGSAINPIVDLGNVVSLRYNLPVGAYDIYTFVRPDGTGLGAEDTGLELDWDNAEDGKLPLGGEIREETTGVLFLLEGTTDSRAAVEKAMKEFVELIANYYARSGYSMSVETGIVDKDNTRFEF